MTKYERGSRPDRLSLGRSAEPVLDALLDGAPLPDEDPARWQPVAQVLAALTSAPESSELAGEARALAEFRGRAAPRRSRLRNRGWAASLRVPRPAVAAATGAVAMGGLLAVAYAGDLPAAAQRLAHDTIGAPAAAHARGPGSRPAPSPGPGSPRDPTAGQGSSPSGSRPAKSDRRIARGHPSGSASRRWPASSAPASPTGRPGQYSPGQYSPGQYTPGGGSPGGSPTPGPTQQPSPRASSSPSAGATPSPSATPISSQQSPYHHEPAPAATQSYPP